MPTLKQRPIGWVRQAAISASVLALLLVALAVPSSAAPQTQTESSTVQRAETRAARPSAPAKVVATAKLHANYGKLPLSFEPNRGQGGPGVKFLARGSGYALHLTPGEAVLALSKHSADSALSRSSQNIAGNGESTLRWWLLGANPSPEIAGEAVMPGTVSYYSGANAANWLTNIPTYARVRYRSVLPGVDLVYYGHGRQLEYDFVVAPGADPNRIRLRFDGAAPMKVDSSGDLLIPLSGGEVRFNKPVVYQEENGKRRHVSGSYQLLAKNRVGFRIGKYDRQLPLVIDPVLDYATYYGGPDKDSINAIAVDAAGNAFVAGETLVQRGQPNLNCPGGQVCPTSDVDAIVSKIDPTGSTVLWTALVGGSGTDIANAIALDNQGNVFVAGSTTSRFLPTGIGFDPTCGTDGTCGEQTFQFPRTDGFVMRLEPNSVFHSGTYLGGNLEDEILGMAVDASGVYVTGYTNAFLNDFPLVNAASSTPLFANGQDNNIFVAKFTPDLSQLAYSTYFGTGKGFGIAVNALGEAFVVGETARLAFTTPNAFQGNSHDGDAFLVKLSADGASAPYATYLHGTSDPPETAFAVALDSVGIAYLTGQVFDDTFPMVNAFQPTIGAGGDVFVAIIDTTLSGAASLLYSTFLGGAGEDVGRAIAVDAAGNVYVAGYTKNDLTGFPATNPGFPLANPLRPCLDPGVDAQGNWSDFDNPFLSILNPAGSALLFSTCLGSDTERDRALAMALDASGNVYLGGVTQSAQFPVTPGAHGTTYRGNQDGFVAKLSGLLPAPSGSVSISISDEQASEGNAGATPFAFTVSLSAASANPVAVDFATADGGATTADNDYAATSGTLTFAPGETVKTINVDVTGDTTFEPDETFFVNLSNPSGGATITKPQGTGAIQDDDPSTITINIQETISVLDSPNLLTSAMIAVSESITVTDAPALLPSAMIAVNENVAVTDTPQVTPVPLNQPPVASAGPDQILEATSSSGAQVPLSGAGSDPDGDSLIFTWTGPFGALTGANISPVLPLGTHTLTLTVDDGNGHTATDSVTIVVQDTTPPVVTTPANITTEAVGPAGVGVIYSVTANDLVDGLVATTCTPASGSTFALGATTVICSATDARNNTGAGSFTITVQDTTPPVVAPPASITIPASGLSGTSGNNWPVLAAFLLGGSAVDGVDPNPAHLSAQVSGANVDNATLFPVGATTVAFRFQDASGNVAAATSTVNVIVGAPRIAGSIVGKGRDAAGNYFVDLKLANTGSGHARNTQITGLTLRTLSGTGTVTYNTALSGPLPLAVGSVDVGAFVTVRIFLNVPGAVTRFAITEAGALSNVSGVPLRFSMGQSVIP